MRTRSTTVTTAYEVAGQDILVFEAQRTGALTVISSVAHRILLSVTGPEPFDVDPYEKTVHEALDETNADDMQNGDETVTQDPAMAELRTKLEAVNHELRGIIRPDLAEILWPDDI